MMSNSNVHVPSASTTFQKLTDVARLGFYLRDIGVRHADDIAAEALDYNARRQLGLPPALVTAIAQFVVEDGMVTA